MAGPWEQYQDTAPADGPWAKYGEAPKPVSIRGEGFDKAMAYTGEDQTGGFLRGAGSIGTTLFSPVDAVVDFFKGDRGKNIPSRSEERRANLDSSISQLTGADPTSTEYKTLKLGGEVMGTAGIGGAIGNLLSKIPGAATQIPNLIEAIKTGGMTANGAKGAFGLGTRVAGGAVTGGASAGAVNPEDASTGMLVGGTIPAAVKLAGEAGKLTAKGASLATKNVLGMTTGAGAETFGTAYRAGKEGGTSFLDNMRGNVPMTDVVDSAKEALSKMRIERGNQYRSGMVDITKDKTVINFAPIEKAVSSLQQMGSFKGQVINKNAAGTVDEVSGLVNQWKSLDPAEYHTPEGLDALKKAIGDVRDATQYGTPGRKAADTAYNAVKAQIELQAPAYAKVMKDYSQGSDLISEIERSLSANQKASADTAMRKLQSLMRNNVNTNYGNRLGLAKKLEENGADILPAVAGQAASSWTPRGLQGLAATGAGISGITNPATLAALPFTSPRLMGELSYGLGVLNRGAGGAAGSGAATQLLGKGQRGLLDFEQYAPFLSTAPAIAYSQR